MKHAQEGSWTGEEPLCCFPEIPLEVFFNAVMPQFGHTAKVGSSTPPDEFADPNLRTDTVYENGVDSNEEAAMRCFTQGLQNAGILNSFRAPPGYLDHDPDDQDWHLPHRHAPASQLYFTLEKDLANFINELFNTLLKHCPVQYYKDIQSL